LSGRIGAIVLAGGRSSRFGRDKLAEPLDGRPLLHHAVAAVQAVATDVVVVVVAPGTIIEAPVGARLVHDAEAFEGPLAGLAAGLAALDPAVDRAIVVAGDMPSLQPTVLARLIGAIGSTADVAVLELDGRLVPFPMALRPPEALVAARRLLATGERRLRAVPETLPTQIIAEATWRLDDPGSATLRDIDTPADLVDAD
jgi:molybdopterin-guanine dinucleotide biosynthesis protein A